MLTIEQKIQRIEICLKIIPVPLHIATDERINYHLQGDMLLSREHAERICAREYFDELDKKQINSW